MPIDGAPAAGKTPLADDLARVLRSGATTSFVPTSRAFCILGRSDTAGAWSHPTVATKAVTILRLYTDHCSTRSVRTGIGESGRRSTTATRRSRFVRHSPSSAPGPCCFSTASSSCGRNSSSRQICASSSASRLKKRWLWCARAVTRFFGRWPRSSGATATATYLSTSIIRDRATDRPRRCHHRQRRDSCAELGNPRSLFPAVDGTPPQTTRLPVGRWVERSQGHTPQTWDCQIDDRVFYSG